MRDRITDETPKMRETMKNRRVLMVTTDAGNADIVARVLAEQGVQEQRLTCDDDGLCASHLVDTHGKPSLPLGMVSVIDIDTWHASLKAGRITRAADAVISIVETVHAGSTADHVLLVSAEDELRSAARIMNILTDRMVEADLVDQVGGPDGASPMIRRFMRWLPQLESNGDRKTTQSHTGDRAVLVVSKGSGADEVARAATMAAVRHTTTIFEGPAITDALDTPKAASDRMHLDDIQLDRLFGDDVLERERQSRMTIVYDERSMLRDFDAMRIDLPERGYDHRAINEQFNQRRAIRGSRKDRRVNRGGRGRR